MKLRICVVLVCTFVATSALHAQTNSRKRSQTAQTKERIARAAASVAMRPGKTPAVGTASRSLSDCPPRQRQVDPP